MPAGEKVNQLMEIRQAKSRSHLFNTNQSGEMPGHQEIIEDFALQMNSNNCLNFKKK